MVKRTRYPTVKPHPSYPLTPRSDGRFQKSINGQVHIFGSAGNWQAALSEFYASVNSIHHGQGKPQSVDQVVTVRQCANRYLKDRDADVAAGNLTLGSWGEYQRLLTEFAGFAGNDVPMAALAPATFTRFAIALHQRLGSYAYNRSRALIMAWLRHAAASDWIKPVNVGVSFRRVPASKMRAERKPRMFTADQARSLIAKAIPQMRAMIYLGINAGFGTTDCAHLLKADVVGDFISYRRRKTGIGRSVVLWPETVAALVPLIAARPIDDHIFRTKFGALWVRQGRKGKRVTSINSVSNAFATLAKDCGIKGLGFYCLRHTFRTIADEARDPHAVARIMGHSLPGMADVYVEAVSRERLEAVVNHVRSWLYPK